MPVHIHTEAFCCFHTVQQYNWGVYPPIFAYIFAGVHLVRVWPERLFYAYPELYLLRYDSNCGCPAHRRYRHLRHGSHHLYLPGVPLLWYAAEPLISLPDMPYLSSQSKLCTLVTRWLFSLFDALWFWCPEIQCNAFSSSLSPTFQD